MAENKATGKCYVWFPIERLVSEDLPKIFVCCGAPATRIVRQRFGVLRRAGLGPLVSTRLKRKAPLPVCDKHRHHWRIINALFAAVMISGILILISIPIISSSFLPEEENSRTVVTLGGIFGGRYRSLAGVARSMESLDDLGCSPRRGVFQCATDKLLGTGTRILSV